MTPVELLKLVETPVEMASGEKILPDHIYLVVPKKTAPSERIRLAGRSGPLGRVCNAKETASGYDVVATFNRSEVKSFLLHMPEVTRELTQ